MDGCSQDFFLGASTQTFNQGGHGGLSGGAANAAASTQTFDQGGFGGGLSGSAANAGKFMELQKFSLQNDSTIIFFTAAGTQTIAAY